MRHAQTVSAPRRARTLAISLTLLFMGASFYAHNVRAEARCDSQADFLVKADPLMAPVQPADCARLFDGEPAFAWPGARATSFVVTLTYPDGRTASVPTGTNWLAWEAPLPPGDYSWTVTAVGSTRSTSTARRFTVDRSAARM